MIQVSALTKAYGRRLALDGATFSIRGPEVLGLIGPNGAGKTTLLECLAGVRPPTAGSVLADGVALDDRARRALMFYMPDAIAPWPAQTVRWALEFTIGFFRGHGALRDELVSALGLAPLLDARMASLSKGERKRTLLAIGLLTPAPVLLVDEPFDGLDLRQSRQAAALLRSMAARGRTLVLSIHQIAEAARLCDRLVLLSAGRIVAEGTAAEIAARAGTGAADLEEAFLALA